MTDNVDGSEPLPTPDAPEADNTLPADEPQDNTGDIPAADENAPPAEAPTEPEPEPKKTAWYMREIGSQREKNQTLKAQNEALLEQLASLRGGNNQTQEPTEPASVDGQKPITQADIDRLVTERAQYLTQAQQYAAQCNSIYDSGTKEFQDFDESVKILGAVGVLPPANQPPTPLMQMVTDLPDAHKILYQLSQDPDRAAQLMTMPIAKQALELAKMQQGLNAPKVAKPISNAPAPIKPIGGTSKAEPSIDDPNLSMDKYLALRNKQREAKGKPLFNA